MSNKAPQKANTRIYFEDHGQDFLWWDLNEKKEVVDCGPFQASVWVGSKVTSDLEQGTQIDFISKFDDILKLNYPIQTIENYNHATNQPIQ